MQPIAKPLEVLLHPVLDYLGPVPDISQVRIGAPDHRRGFMPQLALVSVLRSGGSIAAASDACVGLTLQWL